MDFSPEYIKQQERVIKENFENRHYVLQSERFKILKRFVEGAKKSIDIGSGGFMPHYLGVTHACDISPLSGRLLKGLGWKGKFKVCSCDKLTYLDKSFDVAVCSEVIEHLPKLDMVIKTIYEINRIAKKWIITTPCASAPGFRDAWNKEPDHKHFFTAVDLIKLSRPISVTVEVLYDKGVYYAFLKNRYY